MTSAPSPMTSSTSSTSSLYSPTTSASASSSPYLASSSSSSSFSSIRPAMETVQRPAVAPVQVVHLTCLRCQRSVELTSTDDISSNGMVQIGFNIYYCKSCAKTTGYT